MAENFKANPQITITNRPTNAYAYIMFDAIGRSGFNTLKDRRVRQAVLHAINRTALVNALQPPEIAKMPLQQSMCHPWNIGCNPVDDHTPLRCREGQATACRSRVPQGFKLTIGTWGASRPVAEAVAGQLRAIGVQVTLDAMALPAFVKKRGAGELQTFIALWDNSVGAPDVDNTAGFFYNKSDRNYNGDDELTSLYQQGLQEFDPTKRLEIYRKLFDKVNTEAYSMPLIPLAGT